MKIILILSSLSVVLSGCVGISSMAVKNPTYFETTEYNNQYGLNSIGASEAYSNGYSDDLDSEVIVAVIDIGVDLDYPDLVDNIAPSGYDYFDDSDANPAGQGSFMSHGTRSRHYCWSKE